MVGTHKERIEELQAKFDALGDGMAKINRMEKMMERILRKKGKKATSNTSSVGSEDSGGSSDDI